MADLQEASMENMVIMIEEIKSKLKMASAAAMQASSYNLSKYEDIKDIYEVITSKNNFSISEVEAIVSELGKLRN
ncbi:DUF1128 domain-containing protein [Paenibacillus endoradicis]|uniref:DUF1128 domain-containing protein n=1 Tax=Paenibacillus endoradicis TaxID=2972487 RepID=UPI00215955B2|nr:DUF1128 domain-containing protein [Paenibacillus endoradicis]MCR8657306.1 DUF1128 domain-containing protein [Paenibacillus endoradicis]